MPEDNKEYRVVISDQAVSMMIRMAGYLAQASEQAAQNTMEVLLQAIGSLAAFPDRYPKLSDPDLLPRKYHKMTVEKRYLVIYQVNDDTVNVDAVVDCRQEYRWLL